MAIKSDPVPRDLGPGKRRPGVSASVTAVGKPREPRACAVLRQGLEGTFVWHNVSHSPSQGSHVLSCEYLDKPNYEFEWRASFGWVPYQSAAKARQAWQNAWATGEGSAHRLALAWPWNGRSVRDGIQPRKNRCDHRVGQGNELRVRSSCRSPTRAWATTTRDSCSSA